MVHRIALNQKGDSVIDLATASRSLRPSHMTHDPKNPCARFFANLLRHIWRENECAIFGKIFCDFLEKSVLHDIWQDLLKHELSA